MQTSPTLAQSIISSIDLVRLIQAYYSLFKTILALFWTKFSKPNLVFNLKTFLVSFNFFTKFSKPDLVLFEDYFSLNSNLFR